jgi:hypothetical protein
MSEAEEVPYTCTLEGGEPSNSSRNVTGKVQIQYPNGDKYDGMLLKGVSFCNSFFILKKVKIW